MDSHPDRDLYPDPRSEPDANPVLDPDPIPNIVLHPGDRIYYSRWDNGTVEYRLLDRNGHVYAVLDGHGHPTNPGDFVIDAIRFVSALGGRELLPVRPQPDPHGLTVWDAQPQPDGDPGVFRLIHTHRHSHYALGVSNQHAHEHEHVNADAGRAGHFGHDADLHAHEHPHEPG